MIGLSQRCIIVAKNGGKIVLNDGVAMSGSTIYSMDSIIIGRNTDIGSGCNAILSTTIFIRFLIANVIQRNSWIR